jgi:hypothetical protein
MAKEGSRFAVEEWKIRRSLVNTNASWPDLIEAESRVLKIQTKLHQWAKTDWHEPVESRMRGDMHVRFGGAGRGNGPAERRIPRPDPTLTVSQLCRRVFIIGAVGAGASAAGLIVLGACGLIPGQALRRVPLIGYLNNGTAAEFRSAGHSRSCTGDR